MSLKTKIIKEEILNNNAHWKLFTRSTLRTYIKDKYKVSMYTANKVIKEMYDTKEENL